MVAFTCAEMAEKRFSIDGVFEDDATLLHLGARHCAIGTARRLISLDNGDGSTIESDRLVESTSWEL